MRFPDFLEPWKTIGRQLFLEKKIGEVLFSGPTYQIEVQDGGHSFWVFLQLVEEGAIKDIFCSCDESTERGSCHHMAAAYFFIFSDHMPLHERFKNSFWSKLFFLTDEKCGLSKPDFKKVPDGFEGYCGKRSLFKAVVTKKGEEILQTLLTAKGDETEETSIKFSNLSEEEIEHWKQGRPSRLLRYELSCFSDIAKWFFLQQAKGDQYRISFTEEGELPHEVSLEIPEFSFRLPLLHEDLELLIPSLNSVTTSLPLLQERDVQSVRFDPTTGSFALEYSQSQKEPSDRVAIGNYFYLPSKGFVSTLEQSKTTEMLKSADEISRFLDHSASLLQNFGVTVPVHLEAVAPKYALFFDKDKALHIETFLFEKKDLDPASAYVWGEWAFCKKEFYRVEPLKFGSQHVVIPHSKIHDFIQLHRSWLSQLPGFAVHNTKLQEEIVYDVDSNGTLTFHSIVQKSLVTTEQIDLGDWIYVMNDGFYVKHFHEDSHPLPMDMPILRHLVADFIRHHTELLQSVQGFFAIESPIKQVGLSITLKKKGLIEILPEYEWFLEEDQKHSFFYDECIFVRDKGFYRLPLHWRPLHFTRTVTADDPEVWSSFFLEQLPLLKAEYPCYVDKRLEKPESLALTIVPLEGEKEQQSLSEYSLDIFWRTDKGKIIADELIAAKKRQERFIPTDAGLIDLSEDRFHWIDMLVERKKKQSKTASQPAWRLFPADFLRLQAYDTITVETAGFRTRESFKGMLEKLLVQVPFEPPCLDTFNCSLRPYQTLGVDWLWFLYLNGLSGLLCDDMGVGKTHQAMGLMDAVVNFRKKEKQKSHFLIICPTSLIYHWQDKIARFLPFLRVNVYAGLDRSLDEFVENYDVLLLTYGIFRNESSKIKKIYFDAAFFDELQIAKNHVSQIHGALLQVQAHMKVGLTGTPIENQLRELKALFDIILPGYMPGDSDFREFFIRPIEKMEKPERRGLLSRFVRPFVLRRRKIDVLPDLPEKTEEIYYTEMAEEQKHLYRNVAAQQAMPLIQQLRDESLPIPYMHIFALLSSLKQICNHPASYLKDAANYERYESGKWESFIELLEEAHESQQKVVVFSQYLTMLDIMEAYLKKKKIGYAQIRGQTKARASEVERFHQDPNCIVFLGSLQAAGLGIDLTPASIVIHYDRWWNAARENQATDRVYRIGQVRGVQVFKLLTRATIEEKIDLMIGKKAGLLEDIISVDDHQIVKKLTRQEIISLLEDLPEE